MGVLESSVTSGGDSTIPGVSLDDPFLLAVSQQQLDIHRQRASCETQRVLNTKAGKFLMNGLELAHGLFVFCRGECLQSHKHDHKHHVEKYGRIAEPLSYPTQRHHR